MKNPVPFGKYLLLDRINVGGMAEVFLAKSNGPDGSQRLIALKKIIPTMVEDEEFINMFIDEARIAVQLNHANVVQIHELGKHEEHYFIAMDYLSGRDLRVILDTAKKRRQKLPLRLSVYLTHQICQGLDYAHRKKDSQGRDMNIVHRDVSPQNVLVAYEGEVKVIDFGIAKATNRSQKTQAGILKGKFGYMSPEQVRGLPIDRRSDIFALGVVFYELLTGERLFVGESDFSTLEKVRNAEVLPPRDYNDEIPEELEGIVLKSLARDPEDRYQWAGDMAEDLVPFLVEGDTVFGQKELAAFMQRIFAAEYGREQERLASFLPAEQTEGTEVPARPPPVVESPPLPPGARVRSGPTSRDLEPERADDEEDGDGEKTQLFNPALALGLLSPDAPGPSGLPPQPAETLPAPEAPAAEGKTVIRHEPSNPRVAKEPSLPRAAREASMPRAARPASNPPRVPPRLEPAPPRTPPPTPQEALRTVLKVETGVPREIPQSLLDEGLPDEAGELTGSRPLMPVAPSMPVTPALDPAPAPRRGASRTILVGILVGATIGTVLLAAVIYRRNAAARLGQLAVSPHPAVGAHVLIDGRPVIENGRHVFVSAPLAPGPHVIDAANGYGKTELAVTVVSGEIRPVEVQMAAAPAPTAGTSAPVPSGHPHLGLDLSSGGAHGIQLTILSSPAGAEIFVDGASVGHGRYVLEGADPEHVYRLAAEAPGRKRAERTGRFAESQTITLSLEKVARAHAGSGGHRHARGGPPGDLIISSRPVARVFVDGRDTQRYTPVPPNDALHLPSGDHAIHLESDDGRKADREVSIHPNGVTRLTGVILN